MKLFFLLLLILPAVAADSGHDGPIVFPQWTYWVEIFEHAAILVISLVMMALLLKRNSDRKFTIAGFGILALSELLTTVHHFLVYPFGIWNSIVNHGLLLVAISLIAYSIIKKRV